MECRNFDTAAVTDQKKPKKNPEYWFLGIVRPIGIAPTNMENIFKITQPRLMAAIYILILRYSPA